MVLVKIWTFFQRFFQAILVRKMTFSIFQIEKTPFQAKKTGSSKSQKIDIFPKKLTHGFGSNMAIFPTFFLGNIGQENDFYDNLERKSAFLGNKSKKFQKSKMENFAEGLAHGFGANMAIFPTLFLRQYWLGK